MSQPQLTSLVDHFLISRQAAGLSPRTVQFYEQQLRYFIDSLPQNSTIANLTIEAVEFYLTQRQKEVCPRSVHAAWRAIRAFCNWLETRQERFPEWTNPIPKITPPKLPKKKVPAVNRNDLNKMVKTCKRHTFYDDRDRAVLLVLASSGLRASEFLNLKMKHVNLSNGAVRVEHGKGGTDRITIISPEARLALADYLSHLLDKDGNKPLWWSRQGPLTYSGLHNIIKSRAQKAGVPCPGIHAFRRRWASDMVSKLGPHIVQALGGWENIASMKPYIQLTEEDLLKAYENTV